MHRIIFHIDVNSAFLSWSAVDRLEHGETLDIRTIPAIIGGDSATRHGVVLAKSVPAKAYKIVTGEPVANALRKCPTLMLVPPDHAMYQRKSHALMELLHTYTDDIEQLSIDECFLDFSPLPTGMNLLLQQPKSFLQILNHDLVLPLILELLQISFWRRWQAILPSRIGFTLFFRMKLQKKCGRFRWMISTW